MIYIDDISRLALSGSSKLSLYADDMPLYKTISSTADYAELQQEIYLIYSWSAANLMTFNVSKCKWMFVSRRRNTVCPPINLNLNDHQLENVQTYKYSRTSEQRTLWDHGFCPLFRGCPLYKGCLIFALYPPLV